MFTELLPSNGTEIHIKTHRHASNNSFIVASILCHGLAFSEPLPSNERRNTHTDTETDGRDL
jgi:hypothetical protein